jgi:FtsP/CotA-like multicopper oxidase with cupredoxin domain
MSAINRRLFLRVAGGFAALAGGGLGAFKRSSSTAVAATSGREGTVPDLEIALRATQARASILPGQQTQVWSYASQLVKGNPANLQVIAGTYPGPIIRVRKGALVRVRFTNDLPEPSSIHWHGLLVPDRMDGHPRDVVAPGGSYVYEFPVLNRAGTYWFHPHPHALTGGQVYRGLAGLFIVSDDEEAGLNLPSGEYDVPLVLQDRTFDAQNQLVYLQGGMGGATGGHHGMTMGRGGTMDHQGAMAGMGGMMDRLMGFLGERILVNGRPDFVLLVSTRAYRLRLLNGSNSRVYKLAWHDGSPLTVIATDGGLLAKPAQRPYVMLGPGERVELWADFSTLGARGEMRLQSLAFSGAEGDEMMGGHGAMGGMHGMMGSARALPNGAPFPVLRVRVVREERETRTLPTVLTTLPRHRLDDAVKGRAPRRFALTMRAMNWLINGRSFEMEEVAPDEVVRLNTVEAWEFVNERNPGEMMEQNGMVHPMHIHGVQFQVIERQVASDLKTGWDTVKDGYVDEGWKDTFLHMPGERVKLVMRFQAHPGLFLYHCHNLEHEDMGMMRNYRIEA